MNMNRQELASLAGMALLLAVFVWLKLPVLGLPYFMDEAWSYAPAVHAMHDSGPSLLPGAIEPEHSRGHPLMFYFLAGSWMRAFGPDLASTHAFALTVTLIVLLLTCRLGQIVGGGRVAGFCTALVLAAQPAFFSQSVLVLPEMLVAGCAVLALIGLVEDRLWLFALGAALMLLAKESGIALLAAGGLWQLSHLRKLPRRTWLQGMLWTIAPALPVSIFFLLQKLRFGWFLYPDHVGMMERSLVVLLEKTWSIVTFLFFNKGASVSLFAAFVVGGFFLCQNWRTEDTAVRRFWLFSMLFSVLYIGFSALNFLTMRYLLVLYPLLAVGAIWSLARLTRKLPQGPVALTVLALAYAYIGSTLWYTPNSGIALRSDTNMAYVDIVQVHQGLINECKRRSLYRQPLDAHFLTYFNLKYPQCGYLEPDSRPFNARMIDETFRTPSAWLALTTVEADSHRQALLADTARYRVVWHIRQSAAEGWLLRKVAPDIDSTVSM